MTDGSKKAPVSKQEASHTDTSIENDVAATRQYIHNVLEEASKKSKASGKPVLIMVGEDHTSSKSALLDVIVMQEAQKLGIKDVALEIAREDLQTYQDVKMGPQGTTGLPLLSNLAPHQGLKLHIVDNNANKIADPMSWEGIQTRNENIAANMQQLNKPAMLVVGQHHLDGLNGAPELHRQFEVVALNTCPNRRDINQTPVHQLSLNNQSEAACGNYLANKALPPDFIEHQEKQGNKLTHTEARRLVRKDHEDNRTLTTTPPQELYTYARAHAELGDMQTAATYAVHARAAYTQIALKNGVKDFNDIKDLKKSMGSDFKGFIDVTYFSVVQDKNEEFHKAQKAAENKLSAEPQKPDTEKAVAKPDATSLPKQKFQYQDANLNDLPPPAATPSAKAPAHTKSATHSH